MKKLLAVGLIILSSPLLADNCDKPRDDFDGLYCLNKVYQEADNELNKAYGELRTLLKKQEQKQLKKTQVAWIKQRNKACSLRKENQFFVSLGCTTVMTVKRTNEIRDRIRECKATGCQASKL